MRALYEPAEASTADAVGELIARADFSWLVARSAENVVALTRLASDMADRVLRNLRLAGRADVQRLEQQLREM